MQAYFENRPNLSLILLLCDLRHLPTKDDLEFAMWAAHFRKPFLIVFTKSDKLPHAAVEHHAEKNLSFALRSN